MLCFMRDTLCAEHLECSRVDSGSHFMTHDPRDPSVDWPVTLVTHRPVVSSGMYACNSCSGVTKRDVNKATGSQVKACQLNPKDRPRRRPCSPKARPMLRPQLDQANNFSIKQTSPYVMCGYLLFVPKYLIL